jgi:hypothetical protein
VPLDAGTQQNLRGAGWSPDGARVLLAGNRGTVVLHDAKAGVSRVLPAVVAENLRRVAWSPDGASALIVGNGGCVLRFDAATESLVPLPGDRAHTLRSVAWRPDGAYALVGGYASPFAGYPRPYALYRCDGRFLQGILASDDEDDALAIDWEPGAGPPRALILLARYGPEGLLPGKIVSFDGSGFAYRTIPRMARREDGVTRLPGAVVTLLGLGWHPDGDYALLCGERGKLLTFDGRHMRLVPSGTRQTLVGPFWQPGVASPVALLLSGPEERVYTV